MDTLVTNVKPSIPKDIFRAFTVSTASMAGIVAGAAVGLWIWDKLLTEDKKPESDLPVPD